MKSRLGVILLGLLVFFLGGVAGAASFYLYCERPKTSSPKANSKVDDVVDWMAREIKLDAKQKEGVKVVIIDVRGRYRALWQEFRPRYELLRKESDDRINALLREDQKPLFEEFLRKLRSSNPSSSKTAESK
jgi:hypothetical protein